MESPPSFSTHSEVPLLSEDSGLFITSGSFSSDSASGWHHVTSELQESDYDERSLSFYESSETPKHMCGDNFNTVKKGPSKVVITTIEPPPEFQDRPIPLVSLNKSNSIEVACSTDDTYVLEPAKSATLDVPSSAQHASPVYSRKLKAESLYERRHCLNHRYTSPRLLHLSPCRATRPSSRNSLTSRLSSSHNSLVTQFQTDDSSFITQAISHDTLSAKTSDITDMYNVPLDSDIYAVPIDMVKPVLNNLRHKGKKPQRATKKRKSVSHPTGMNLPPDRNPKSNKEQTSTRLKDLKPKRHSFQISTSKKNINESDTDSLHMTLREMRKYLHTLYSSSSDSENKNTVARKNNSIAAKIDTFQVKSNKDSVTNGKITFLKDNKSNKNQETNNNSKKSNKNSLVLTKSKKLKDNSKEIESEKDKSKSSVPTAKSKVSPVRILSINLKQSFCNLFRWRRGGGGGGEGEAEEATAVAGGACRDVVKRALPPLPLTPPPPHSSRRSANDEETVTDFATSIQKVKDYGWYWGPISVEHAEKILSNEPDGSFIVRDSSDDHYIFTLTFKLNGLRHVRIEHDQGNFCFGGCTMFKAQTIVEFIENAVETSRSGRYLFFLNLRPVLGPVRVQLLYPVSRFKRVQSLQHMCRFVILKHVRRDLVSSLPLPRRLVDYLSATHYYSELLSEI